MSANSQTGRLLEAARAGSREALGQLLEACRGYLLFVAHQELAPNVRGKEAPSDLVQHSFLEAQRDFAHFQGNTEAELLGWMRRILLNNVANCTRRYRGTSKRSLAREVILGEENSASKGVDRLPAEGPSPSRQAVAKEEAVLLARALEQLPDDYRQVLLLRYQEEKSFEDIARVMNRSANAVRKLWLRAIDRLQKDIPPS